MKLKVGRIKNRVGAYARVWWRLTILQFEQQIANARLAATVLILGKIARLAFAFLFLYIIVDRAGLLAGYDLYQAVFILALFNLVSTITQLFFRGVYLFRQKVIDGNFDFYLLNPLSELFYSLFSYTDPLDMLLTLPYTAIVFWSWSKTGFPITPENFLYLLLTIAIMGIIIFAIHIFIIGVGIKYLEVDNTIMLYRDLERTAGFPMEIYGKFGSIFLTYIIPFGLMSTVPAKIIFGLLSPGVLLLFLVIALTQLHLALSFWRSALKSYSSASS